MDVPPVTPMPADEAAETQNAVVERLISAYELYWHFMDNDDPVDGPTPSCAILADAYGQFWQTADD